MVASLLVGCAGTDARLLGDRDEVPPVVVIVLDELPLASLMDRTGRIDRNLFPNFARLQQDSTWFRNATTSATFTHEVMPSILTGSRPSERLQSAPLLPHNIFTLLAGTHDLYTTQPFPRFCPGQLCRDMPPAPADEPLRREWPAFTAGERGEKFLSLASFLEPTLKPRLYFAHFVMPHQPWAYMPSGERYPAAELLPGQIDVPGRGKGWTDHWWLTAQAMQRHLLQTRFTDGLLGALLDRMEETEIYDDALVIATADHGIAFETGLPKRIATPTTAGQLAPVPLLVKRPHQRGSKISDAPVEVVDITPSIADVVGLPYEWSEVDGRSLFHRKGVWAPTRSVNGIPISPNLAEVHDAVELKYRMFARDGDSIDLLRPGSPSVREAIGRELTEFEIVSSATKAELSNEQMLREGRTANGMIPSLLHGTLSGPAQESRLLAVSLNGRIAAFTPTYIEEGRTNFYLMLPPRFLATDNEVEVFYVLEGQRLAEIGEVGGG